MEQRKTKRFDLRLPLKLIRHGPKPIAATGQTRNVSSRGVLFDAEAKVEIGEPIEYVITLPLGPNNANAVAVHCLGKVLRASSLPGKHEPGRAFSVAATLERYEFVRLKSA